MNKLYYLLILSFFAVVVKAQTREYGKVDTADLKLATCDFEKDANAMVLFDDAKVHYNFGTVIIERHKRIKIFNDKGMDAAKVRMAFFGVHNDEIVSKIMAETVNLNNNTIEYLPVDPSLIFTQNIDKERKVITFTFPKVKPGSIIEFQYKWSSPYADNLPDWFFQVDIPTRNSRIQCEFTNDYTFKIIKRVTQKFSIDTSFFTNGTNTRHGTTRIWALSNVHSIKDEPFMRDISENIQRILFQVTDSESTWATIVTNLFLDDDFGRQLSLSINLEKQDEILTKIRSLQTNDEKIAYVFNLVKNTVKYNHHTSIFTNDGIKRAWNKKQGTASEINLIIYHFLKKAGIDVMPMIVNTDGIIETTYASIQQVDRTVCYIKVDSTKQYILDAADKYSVCGRVPYYLLNSNALLLQPGNKTSKFIESENHSPIKKTVFINAEIAPDGLISGKAQISNQDYNRILAVEKYKEGGEKDYIDHLRDDDDNLKISSFKMENMEADSLPLNLSFDFKSNIQSTDDKYIYFNPNLLTGIKTNPFLSEERFSDIDFKYCNNYSIGGRYKIPAGYKIDAMPSKITILNPDKSISFKRVIAEEDGYVSLHYVINYKRSYFSKDEYPDLREFYRKMYELLNEQVVLKKT